MLSVYKQVHRVSLRSQVPHPQNPHNISGRRTCPNAPFLSSYPSYLRLLQILRPFLATCCRRKSCHHGTGWSTFQDDLFAVLYEFCWMARAGTKFCEGCCTVGMSISSRFITSFAGRWWIWWRSSLEQIMPWNTLSRLLGADRMRGPHLKDSLEGKVINAVGTATS